VADANSCRVFLNEWEIVKIDRIDDLKFRNNPHSCTQTIPLKQRRLEGAAPGTNLPTGPVRARSQEEPHPKREVSVQRWRSYGVRW